jgi:hypothetical protein
MNEIFELIAKLAEKEGVSPIVNKIWQYEVDEHWSFTVNGKNNTTDGIPPFNAMIVFNGFPAGIVGFDGGIIAAGEAANEDTFIKAMQKKLSD